MISFEKVSEEVETQISKKILQKRDTLVGSFKTEKVAHRGGTDEEIKTGTFKFRTYCNFTASSVAPVERDKFYWNERFQHSIEKVAIFSEEISQRNHELDQLANDFCKIAVPLVQKIIRGEQLNESASKIGGVAGGS